MTEVIKAFQVSHPNIRTTGHLSAGIAFLEGEHKTNYTIIMAGSMMAILPMIVIFFVFQRSFIQGIAFTGSKS